tara:strand:- start:118 stop:384 length:267 start_codon:yes stop_codon:yes gene_type:complete
MTTTMISNIMLSSLLLFGSHDVDFSAIWKKVEGEWSYVGQVKEKKQILGWIEKIPKTPGSKILNIEIRKMPFITLLPTGEVVNLEPLQ